MEALRRDQRDPLVSWVPVVHMSLSDGPGGPGRRKQVLAALPEVPGGLCRSDAHKLGFGWS